MTETTGAAGTSTFLPQDPTGDAGTGPLGRVLRSSWLWAGCLATAVLLVHDVTYMLGAPFFVDEAWVVVSSQAPLDLLPHISMPTPIGFTFLVWLWPGGSSESYRLIPLVFSMGTAAAAFAIARGLAWERQIFGLIAGLAAGFHVVLLPSSMLRNDLKQYTADAFVSLLILMLCSRLESSWTRRGICVLVVAAVVGALISNVSAFVSLSVFAGLFVTKALARDWKRMRESLVAGGVASAAIALIFFAFVFPGVTDGLRAYFDETYLEWSSLLPGFWERLSAASPNLGWETPLLSMLLFGLGVFWTRRLGRPALATTVVILWILMVVLGVMHRYPFLNLRTSHFLFVITAVISSIGLVGTLIWVTRVEPPLWGSHWPWQQERSS